MPRVGQTQAPNTSRPSPQPTQNHVEKARRPATTRPTPIRTAVHREPPRGFSIRPRCGEFEKDASRVHQSGPGRDRRARPARQRYPLVRAGRLWSNVGDHALKEAEQLPRI